MIGQKGLSVVEKIGFTALRRYTGGYRLNDISLQRLLWFPISVSTITFGDTKNSDIHVLDWDPRPRKNWHLTREFGIMIMN